MILEQFAAAGEKGPQIGIGRIQHFGIRIGSREIARQPQ